ncbi:MAG: type II toxin-antitoxin system VapC family toxin [Bacteroidetes bacterium]|nr:type II toxin-antitoxin system VapC family toxin [Bacteroidota bacterium]
MLPRVYIETTIPSFYYTRRSDPESVARRRWTKRWWAHSDEHYELVTSPVTLDELERGSIKRLRERRLSMLRTLPVLAISEQVLSAAETYVTERIMPADVAGDALHLALASVHACDYLLTWNCRHLANENKAERIALINQRLGLPIPRLVTPLQLPPPEK